MTTRSDGLRTIVPFDPDDPCTRLAPVLDPPERREFAAAMRDDVLDAVRAGGGEPELLSPEPIDADVPVTVDERSLSKAVNGVLAAAAERLLTGGRPCPNDTGQPVAVVMADLALATPRALAALFDADGDVVIAPGRGAGTNALVVRDPEFRVDYHGASYLDHRRAARNVEADVRTIDSYQLATDIDEPADLSELLVHGDGRAARWLRDAGFEVTVGEGRTAVERADDVRV